MADPILRQVGQRHAAFACRTELIPAALLGFHDGLCHRAAIERIRALGRQQLQGFRQIGLHQPVAFYQRHPAGPEDCSGFRLQLGAAVIVGDVFRHETVDAEAVLGQFDCRGQGIGQPSRAPAAQCRIDSAQGAGHADRQAAGRGQRKGHRRAIGCKHVGAGCSRRALARIDDEGFAGSGQMNHHETAAADAGRLRLDHIERELHCGSGIDGIAALRQQARAGGGRSGVRNRHHAVGRGGQHRG